MTDYPDEFSDEQRAMYQEILSDAQDAVLAAVPPWVARRFADSSDLPDPWEDEELWNDFWIQEKEGGWRPGLWRHYVSHAYRVLRFAEPEASYGAVASVARQALDIQFFWKVWEDPKMKLYSGAAPIPPS